jgi:hypothetical protein
VGREDSRLLRKDTAEEPEEPELWEPERVPETKKILVRSYLHIMTAVLTGEGRHEGFNFADKISSDSLVGVLSEDLGCRCEIFHTFCLKPNNLP